MILNEIQYKVTQTKLEDLEKDLTALTPPPAALHPRQILSRTNSLNILIGTLKQEMVDYNNLKNGTISEFPIDSIQELPIVIIKARIARGMTQKDLAEKIGIQEEQIKRHEAHEYYGVEFNVLQEIMSILDITFSSALLSLKEPLVQSELTTNNTSIETDFENKFLATISHL
jgi:HTH-type transcriptional regulator / antitoxin HipB